MIEFDLITGKDKSPDMTPMIDMVFLLLIFFLLTSVFRVPAVETELPGSSTAVMVKPEEFIVSVKDNGNIYFNEERVSMSALKQLIAHTLSAKTEKDITIASDKTVSFDKIIAVMDIARSAGADSVSFLTEDEN